VCVSLGRRLNKTKKSGEIYREEEEESVERENKKKQRIGYPWIRDYCKKPFKACMVNWFEVSCIVKSSISSTQA